MGTPFQEIYERFTFKITDYNFVNLNEEDQNAILFGYLRSAIAKCKKLKSDLSKRDCVNLTFDEVLLDLEIEILSIMMVVEWVTPQINNIMLTTQFLGEKEAKFYSQANHLEQLIALRKVMELEAKNLIRDYGYEKRKQESLGE